MAKVVRLKQLTKICKIGNITYYYKERSGSAIDIYKKDKNQKFTRIKCKDLILKIKKLDIKK